MKQQSARRILTSCFLVSISRKRARIEPHQHGGNLSMSRLPIYVFSISAFLTAWALYRNQRTRPMPAKKAAEMLQEAWADYHTRA
jgi:hypothetical protein